MCNINIRKEHLPGNIKGCIVRCFEDSDWYTIFINASLCESIQHEVLLHELSHIKSSDFSSSLTATQLEEIQHE